MIKIWNPEAQYIPRSISLFIFSCRQMLGMFKVPVLRLSFKIINRSLRVGHDWATSRHFSLSCIGEGNGNPLQCSCLEYPRDGGAWWAAVYGVSQSRTGLKRRSSSSSSSSSKGDTSKLNDNVFMDWITVKISILPKEISDLIQSLLKYLWHFSQNLNKLS